MIVEGILKNRIKSEVKGLLDEENHLFLSQFSPNLPWSAANAMKRNGTIIGLSGAMLLIEAAMDGGTFQAGSCLFVLLRTLQVLGAYGLRGYFERKRHFLESIPYAVANVRELPRESMSAYPYLSEVLAAIADDSRFSFAAEGQVNEVDSKG